MFGNWVSRICADDHFDPIGASAERLTLDHIVLVTNDKDHIETLGNASVDRTRALRWCCCIQSPPRAVPAPELLDWGAQHQRLLEFGAHSLGAPFPAPAGTASCDAARTAVPQPPPPPGLSARSTGVAACEGLAQPPPPPVPGP